MLTSNWVTSFAQAMASATALPCSIAAFLALWYAADLRDRRFFLSVAATSFASSFSDFFLVSLVSIGFSTSSSVLGFRLPALLGASFGVLLEDAFSSDLESLPLDVLLCFLLESLVSVAFASFPLLFLLSLLFALAFACCSTSTLVGLVLRALLVEDWASESGSGSDGLVFLRCFPTLFSRILFLFITPIIFITLFITIIIILFTSAPSPATAATPSTATTSWLVRRFDWLKFIQHIRRAWVLHIGFLRSDLLFGPKLI